MSLQIVNWGQKRLLIDTNRGYPPGNYHIPPEEKETHRLNSVLGREVLVPRRVFHLVYLFLVFRCPPCTRSILTSHLACPTKVKGEDRTKLGWVCQDQWLGSTGYKVCNI